jgi:hypothetical protein
MPVLPADIMTLFICFAPVFSPRVWRHVPPLVVRAILARGQRCGLTRLGLCPLKALLERAGLPYIRIHDQRHTGATLLPFRPMVTYSPKCAVQLWMRCSGCLLQTQKNRPHVRPLVGKTISSTPWTCPNSQK